jgi:hypothetical protein
VVGRARVPARSANPWAGDDSPRIALVAAGNESSTPPFDLKLDFEAMELPSDPGLTLLVYTAAAGAPTADALRLLASWAATQDQPDSDQVPGGSMATRDKE